MLSTCSPRPTRSRTAAFALVAVALGAANLAAGSAPATAQTFVRVVDPANPIVTDAFMSGGGSWIDLVGDGYLDLYVSNGNLTNQANVLYRNDRAGGFVKVVTGAMVTDIRSSIGSTWGDFDGDGILDCFVTDRNNVGNLFYRGLGDTLFTRVTTGSPATDIKDSNSSSWVDLDNDGVLDLYVVNFQGNDFLYHGDGAPNFTFTRVDTTALTTGTEFSIPGAWADYNNDGLEDLFVGNAGTQNDYLYTNHGGLWFTKTVFSDGLSTLGASWGDYDNDGYLDLVVSHLPTSRVTLYHNSGPPDFTLVPQDTSAIHVPVANWIGTAWGDFDNDGFLDLYVSCDGGTSALYRNQGPPGYGFTRVTTGPVATDTGNLFGAVWADYDRDGQLDLFAADHNGAKNHLYHNAGNPNHWLTVRALGTLSNRAAIGAKVHVFATIGGQPVVQLREVTGQTGYNSQNLDQHFGLGDATVADSVGIDWPSGVHDEWAAVPADQFLKLSEGAGTVGVGGPGAGDGLGGLALVAPAPNPSRGSARIAFTLPAAGRASLDVFDVAGRRIATLVDRDLGAGPHAVVFARPAASNPSGVYFARLRWGGRSRAQRIVLLR